MKTIDYVKKHIKEWPEKCDYICVDDGGEIWMNKGNPNYASYDTINGIWSSNCYNSVSPYGDVDLKDNDKVILKRDFGEHGPDGGFSMDDFNERLKALLREAGQNGVCVKEVQASYISSGFSEKKWVLVDVDVEYGM